MHIIISRAKNEDAKDLALLFNQYRMFYKMRPNNFACSQFIQERLRKNDSIMFAAKSKEKMIAFAQVYPSFSSVAMKPIWIINDLFVDENYRKLGAAATILKYIERRAIKDKIFAIKLATEKNNSPAKALYKSLGFKLNERFDNYSLTPGMNIED